MGNRHGGEKAGRDEKEEKRKKRKEKKARKKGKKKGGGSDVDGDPESSHMSRADSESMVFHSAENLSPYLDASTRSEEGAAYAGFHDNGHVLSSRDFHDGFSIEACLPAELAAAAASSSSDPGGDVTKSGDDGTSMASGTFSTPLLSSPDVRRGIPRSPMAARQKDSFLEPVPPIPSDLSSTTLSSAGYPDCASSTPGTQRSSSCASSSIPDTNAAHCIERLEELERNIERTIIEKFAPYDTHHPPLRPPGETTTTMAAENVYSNSRYGNENYNACSGSPLRRRRELAEEERSREGSVTPKGAGPCGFPSRSLENSPAPVRKISEPCRPLPQREGSATPKGLVHGVWSQSAENSPVIVRRALPSPESPVIMRRTPSQSPTGQRKYPANSPSSPVLLRRDAGDKAAGSPGLSPSIQRRAVGVAQESGPRPARRLPELPDKPGLGSAPTPAAKSVVPPPVPPKPCLTLTSPDLARRMQNMPKSPIMARKVYAFQDPKKAKDGGSGRLPWEDQAERGRREKQMPPRSPSRSPEVRHRATGGRKTPSSSPSPKSLGRKLMPLEDRAPPPAPLPASPPQQITFCQQRGTPVKRCIVATQPSTAVVLATGPSQESLQGLDGSSSAPHAEGPDRVCSKDSQPAWGKGDTDRDRDRPDDGSAVSEDVIKQSTESAVFGSVSPKLKRQKKIVIPEQSHGDGFAAGSQRSDSFDSSTSSPPVFRAKPFAQAVAYQGPDVHKTCPERPADASPILRRAQFARQASGSRDEGTLSADIAGGLTYHTHPLVPTEGESHGLDPHPPRSAPHALSPAVYVAETHQDQRGPHKTLPLADDRRTTEGATVYGHARDETHVSQTTLQLAPSTHDEAASLSGESTVAGNAAATGARNAGFSGSGARLRGQCVRACGKESERAPGTAAELATSSPSPDSPASGSGTGKGGAGLARNLGQRIRDVIHKEAAFREVFTAELSGSSSLERDDGPYFSDDSVFVHPGVGEAATTTHDWNTPPPNFHPTARGWGRREEEEEGGRADRRRLSDSLSSSPSPFPSPSLVPRREAGNESRGGDAAADRPTPHMTDPHPPAVACPSPSPSCPHTPGGEVTDRPAESSRDKGGGVCLTGADTTAIRRIDVDVSVPLPHSQSQHVQPTDSAVTANQLPGAARTCGAGQVPGQMDCAAVDSSGTDLHSAAAAVRPAAPEGDGGGTKAEEEKKKTASVEEGTVGVSVAAGKLGECAAEASVCSRNQQHGAPLEQRGAMETANKNDDGGVVSELKGENETGREREKGGKLTDSVDPSPPAPLSSQPLSASPAVGSGTAVEGEEGGGGAAKGTVEPGPPTKEHAAALANGSQQSTTVGVVAGKDTSAAGPSATQISGVAQKTAAASTTMTAQRTEEGATPTLDGTGVVNNRSDAQPGDSGVSENVPPPSPTAMDALVEEEEESEGETEDRAELNAHHDSDISSKISQEMKAFGETVVRRLSSLLESQASESDSCVEEGRTDVGARRTDTAGTAGHHPLGPKAADTGGPPLLDSQLSEERFSSAPSGEEDPVDCFHHDDDDNDDDCQGFPAGDGSSVPGVQSEEVESSVEPVLDQRLQTSCCSDLPGQRLVGSDTTDTLFTDPDPDTSASSKRESTASTATDETLTSFKTRSTTDSAEFEETFVLPESLVFVRSVDGVGAGAGPGGSGCATVEAGRVVKRPTIPCQLTVPVPAPRQAAPTPPSATALSCSPPHKPRKKRRRQQAPHDVSGPKADVTEPVPKRGSKQIREVIDAYCDEISDESDLSSSSTDDVIREGVYHKTFSRSEHAPLERDGRGAGRKPPADLSTDSSDDDDDVVVVRHGSKRLSSSSQESSSLRIPEIEETFGELMGVKTFLEDLAERGPADPSQPSAPLAAGAPGVESSSSSRLGRGEPWSASHYYRRSRTSPARTDRTESDLDVSEQRDDASTDSMYADDEDEGGELLFHRSYSERGGGSGGAGGEVLLSCTIYNSTHDQDGDSDDFWADAETSSSPSAATAAAAAASEETYKSLELSADAAGSAFQNARLQMHDIHQHLQDLRRQMELLQDDITSTSLTLTPDYSLESEQRPVTE